MTCTGYIGCTVMWICVFVTACTLAVGAFLALQLYLQYRRK